MIQIALAPAELAVLRVTTRYSMEPNKINVTDLRLRTREIMERVKYGGESFLVETFGQPTAIILNVVAYDKLNKSTANSISYLAKEPSPVTDAPEARNAQN